MNKIILASHGKLSEGMHNSIQMIVGNVDNCTFYGLQPGQSNEEIATQIESYINGDKENQYVIICDLLGGSVFNAVTRLASDNVIVVSGMNMGLVISCVLETNVLNKEKIEYLINECNEGIKVYELSNQTLGENDII